MLNLIEFNSINPFRAPQWRHEEVRQMLDGRSHPRPDQYDDPAIRAYYRFQRRLAAAGSDEEERENVFNELPSMAHAFQIRQSTDQETRRMLEARLLTDATLDEIADGLGTHPDVIRLYEEIFFNVRDRLLATVWIRMMVLKPPACDSAANSADERRWRMYRAIAYFGGAKALDEVLAPPLPDQSPQTPEHVADFFATELERSIRVAALTSADMPIPQRDALKMVKLVQSLPGTKDATSSDEEQKLNKQLFDILNEIEQYLHQVGTGTATSASMDAERPIGE